MRNPKSLLAVAAVAFAFVAFARAQDDSPSLGDVARQARQQRQQKENAAADSSSPPAKDSTATAPNNNNNDATNKDAQPSSASNGKPGKPAAGASPAAPAAKAPKHVFTNDEIPSKGGPTGYRPPIGPSSSNQPGSPDPGKVSPEVWTAQIQAAKNAVSGLESQIQQLSDSIQYAGANCVSNCAQWNEQQKRKQDQVETMKSQLGQAQQRLEELQEGARQQGYGSSVYDP